jgi:hypothetical protein
MAKKDLKLLHNKLRPVGAGDTHDNFYDSYGESSKAYRGLRDVLTGLVHDAFGESTYLIDPTPPTHLVTFSEGQDLGDDVFRKVKLVFEEDQDMLDAIKPTHLVSFEEAQPLDDTDRSIALTLTMDEPQPLAGDCLARLNIQFEEGQPLGDDGSFYSRLVQFEEHQDLGESELLSLNRTFSEGQDLGDDLKKGVGKVFEEAQPLADDMAFIQRVKRDYSSILEIKQYVSKDLAAELGVLHSTPRAISSITDPLNPFKPAGTPITIIFQGNVIAGNPVVGADNLVWISSLGVAGTCGLVKFNINLTFGGGSFSIQTRASLGNVGGSVEICGLTGTIIETGPIESSSEGNIWEANGIFGSRNMNKELLLTLDDASNNNGTSIRSLFPDQYLQSAPSQLWTTVADVARASASLANVNLYWMCVDAPLTDGFAETGIKVGEAINSLASRVGAVVCWEGGDNYVVIDPTQGYGPGFFLPHCSLVLPGGMRGPFDILDTKGPVVLLPVKPANQGGIVLLPAPFAPPKPPPVEQLYNVPRKIKIDEAPILVDIPGDYKQSKVQIIVQPADLGDPYTTVDGSPENPPQWFDFTFPISVDNVTGKRRIRIDQNAPYPPSLHDKKFNLNVGYIRQTDGLNTSYDADFQNSLTRQKLVIQAQLERIRYFRTKAATVQCEFFGQVPLPGGPSSITFNGRSISGILENVSISGSAEPPYTMSVSIGQYVSTNLLSAKARLDWFLATGQRI